MFHRLNNTATLAAFGWLAVTIWQPAAAEIHLYEGTFTLCTSTCDSFSALGGQGGAMNVQPSDVTGSLDIPNSGPSQSFSFAETDNITFGFEIFNSNAPTEAAVFDGMGNFVNPTTANPLPLSPAVAALRGSGMTDASGQLISGEIVARFTAPPFSSNGAQVYFDLTNGDAEGFLFVNVIRFTSISGEFSLPPGDINVGGAPVTFGDTAVGDTSSADVTITNDGDGNLNVVSVATSNMLAAPFSVGTDGCTGQALAPMGNCVIQVDFAPADGGNFADSFSIVTDDPDTPTVTVDVSGTGLEPNLQVMPAQLDFVATSIGDTSQAIATVTNTGDADLIIGMIDFTVLDSQFVAALDNCSMQTLAPAGICQVTMEFTPASVGIFTTAFNFPSNDTDTPMLNYVLEGEGIEGTIATITVSPGALMFDEILAGEMSELAIQVNSTGNDPLELNALTLSGDDAAEFSQTNNCPAVLPSGQNCAVNVVFAPTTGGAKSATLTIESNGSARPVLPIAITASAFAGPRIVVDPTALELGSPSAPIDVGDTTTADVTVSNTGTSDLTVSMVAISGPGRGDTFSSEFTVDDNGCMVPLAPLDTCIVTVRFSPLIGTDQSGTLSISSDDVDNPTTFVPLTGFVFRGARVDVPDGTIDITDSGSVEIGETAVFDLVVSNSGTEDLEITGFALGGANASAFSFTEACTGSAIPPTGNCIVTITFAPSSAGEKTAELSIFSNDVTLVRAATIVVPLSAMATAPSVMQGPEPGSQTVEPPSFAKADPGGGALGVGLLGLGLVLLLARRRYR